MIMKSMSEEMWGVGKKVLFRFGCLYILLFTLPSPYSIVPGISFLAEFYTSFWNSLGVWFGKSVLSIERSINTDTTGSGDRLIDYIHMLIYFLFAVFGTIIWSVSDRNRANYKKLAHWLTVHLRYYMFATLFMYGMAKVIKTQFPFPSIERLLQPIGDMSPMGLVWTFMGFSEPYTIFAGLMEVLAALLFLSTRTTTLGAIVSLGVMSNVVMMNFSYDIPVKIFSTHLVLFSLVLLLPDIKRLMNVFVLNRRAKPREFQSVFINKIQRYTWYAIKFLFIGFVILSSITSIWQRYQEYGPGREKSHLYGLWKVELFIKNGENVPPLITDNNRWQYLIMEYPGQANVMRMNGGLTRYNAETDTLKKTLNLTSGSNRYKFNYEKKYLRLLLNGENNADSLYIHLSEQKPDKFLLTKRGFNWIQEYPYNR